MVVREQGCKYLDKNSPGSSGEGGLHTSQTPDTYATTPLSMREGWASLDG